MEREKARAGCLPEQVTTVESWDSWGSRRLCRLLCGMRKHVLTHQPPILHHLEADLLALSVSLTCTPLMGENSQGWSHKCFRRKAGLWTWREGCSGIWAGCLLCFQPDPPCPNSLLRLMRCSVVLLAPPLQQQLSELLLPLSLSTLRVWIRPLQPPTQSFPKCYPQNRSSMSFLEKKNCSRDQITPPWKYTAISLKNV